MGRILAIDYGSKRTGIAVTDPSQIIAGGLQPVRTVDLMAFLKQYTTQENVDRIIIGMPKTMRGTLSENAGRIISFIQKFRNEFPSIPIEEYDERFTSVLAHRTMLDSGISKKHRQDKALVDEISATIILQSYMERKKNLK